MITEGEFLTGLFVMFSPFFAFAVWELRRQYIDYVIREYDDE